MHWLSWVPLCEPNCFRISVLRVASGLRVKLVGRKSALNPLWFILLTVQRRWSLLLCGLFYEAICFKSCLVLICSCILSPFSIEITSLGEKRANLSAFRTFVRFALVWFLSVSSSSACLGWAAACDCGTPWIFFYYFFVFFCVCVGWGGVEGGGEGKVVWRVWCYALIS